MKSLKSKFLSIFVTIAALSAIGAGTVIYTMAALRSDGNIINLAGAQRMLSQKITKQALLSRQEPSVTAPLKQSISRFEKVLGALSAGDVELGIPKTVDPEILNEINTVRQQWTPFRVALDHVLAGHADEGDWRTIKQSNEPLMERMNAVVQTFQDRNQAKVNRMIYAQIGVVLSLIVLMSAAWFIVVSPLVRRLTEAAGSLADGADQVAAAAGEVSCASQSLAEGASKQAASIEETSASSHEVSTMATGNSEKARAAAGRVEQTSLKIEEAVEALSSAVSAMREIDESGGEIVKIIRVIDEIAFQTNILALNAAIEAARAGDAGMGFAVVAEEVRSLAQRSAQAAHDTAGLIQTSLSKSRGGKLKVDEVALCFRSIAEDSAAVKRLAEDVSAGSGQQAQGINQIAAAITHMEQVTQTVAAGAEEGAAAAQELTAQSEALRQIAAALTMTIDGRIEHNRVA